MKTLLQIPSGMLLALAMLVILIASPQESLAKVWLSNGSNSGSPGSPGSGASEGDPLDSNDYGDDPIDDIVYEPPGASFDSQLVFRDIGSWPQVIMLQVDFIGGVPVFSIQVVTDSGLRTEASHVR